MTLMLVSVADAAEAELVARLGADIADLDDPRAGRPGEVPVGTARAAASAAANMCAISATLADPAFDVDAVAGRAEALIDAGVSYLKIAVDALSLPPLAPALRRVARRTKLVGVLFAEKSPDPALLQRLSEAGFAGVMLDTWDTSRGRLLTQVGIVEVSDFVARCRALRLAAGVAGSLEPPDIPRLRLVEPDVMGFRGALRRGHDRGGQISPRAVSLVRDLIPPAEGAPHSSRRPEPPSGAGGDSRGDSDVEIVYVRDHLISVDIGAYAFERGARQRVVFDVEATVRRARDHADDLRTIFSYDVILDAIRLATGRGHVNFIETLCEDVARLVLGEPRVTSVRVSVRKLDVIAGMVGVEIRRDRTSGVAPRSGGRPS
jgi:dihydroneopterin aldolase